jgi:hypothetical protein
MLAFLAGFFVGGLGVATTVWMCLPCLRPDSSAAGYSHEAGESVAMPIRREPARPHLRLVSER